MNVLKRLWHLLFDHRTFDWRTSRVANVWGSWHPYIGLGFDFNIEVILPHKARLGDADDLYSWGPEFKFGFGLLWIDFGLTIPNDDYPGKNIDLPPRYCRACGRTTSPMISDYCDGCNKHADSCSCDAYIVADSPTGSASGLKLGSDVTLRRTEVNDDAHV